MDCNACDLTIIRSPAGFHTTGVQSLCTIFREFPNYGRDVVSSVGLSVGEVPSVSIACWLTFRVSSSTQTIYAVLSEIRSGKSVGRPVSFTLTCTLDSCRLSSKNCSRDFYSARTVLQAAPLALPAATCYEGIEAARLMVG